MHHVTFLLALFTLAPSSADARPAPPTPQAAAPAPAATPTREEMERFLRTC